MPVRGTEVAQSVQVGESNEKTEETVWSMGGRIIKCRIYRVWQTKETKK